MIVKTTVQRGHIDNKKGWNFSVYFRKEYAGIISALFKTKKEAEAELQRYIDTGEFVTYGSAE